MITSTDISGSHKDRPMDDSDQDAGCRLLNHHSKCTGFRPKGSPQLSYCVDSCPYRPTFYGAGKITRWHEGSWVVVLPTASVPRHLLGGWVVNKQSI